MSRLPGTLARDLRAAGFDVIEVSGWQTRGRPARTGGFAPVGVNNHHTGASALLWSRAKRLEYARWMAVTGRADLPAPLAHLALGPDGEVYVLAAGRANHAGKARASGTVASGDGNRLYIGIEWMLSGTETIPEVMYAAGARLNAFLLREVLGTSVQTVTAHYATSVTGKWDIGDPNGVLLRGARVLDLKRFRREVAAAFKEAQPARPKKPSKRNRIVRSRKRLRSVRADLRKARARAKERGQVKRLAKIKAGLKDVNGALKDLPKQ